MAVPGGGGLAEAVRLAAGLSQEVVLLLAPRRVGGQVRPTRDEVVEALCGLAEDPAGLRRLLASGVPTVEVGCEKDFPGTWAEYRVFEGGILQVVHRISALDALRWSERCRHLYRDFGLDYAGYALGHLDDRCFPIGLRR